jgi:hypothetical protein
MSAFLDSREQPLLTISALNLSQPVARRVSLGFSAAFSENKKIASARKRSFSTE